MVHVLTTTTTAAATPITPQAPNKSFLDNKDSLEKLRESFVCIDNENQLYSFIVDGHFVDGTRISTEVRLFSRLYCGLLVYYLK